MSNFKRARRKTESANHGDFRMNSTFDPEYAESWTNWAVFPASMSDEEILRKLEASHIDMEPYQRGPGQEFQSRGYLRRSPTRVLFSQRCGLDV